MLVYNKETCNEEGVFYRTEDWGIEVTDDFTKDNFTTEVPQGINQEVIPKQHFDGAWVLDELIDQSTIDSMIVLSKLEVLEAMDTLPEERAKFDVLMTNDLFAERWGVSTDLVLTHPLVVQALASVLIDVDLIKRKIIELNL